MSKYLAKFEHLFCPKVGAQTHVCPPPRTPFLKVCDTVCPRFRMAQNWKCIRSVHKHSSARTNNLPERSANKIKHTNLEGI